MQKQIELAKRFSESFEIAINICRVLDRLTMFIQLRISSSIMLMSLSFSLSFCFKSKQLSWYHFFFYSQVTLFTSLGRQRQTKINLHYAISLAQLRINFAFNPHADWWFFLIFFAVKICLRAKVLFFFCHHTQENVYASSPYGGGFYGTTLHLFRLLFLFSIFRSWLVCQEKKQ